MRKRIFHVVKHVEMVGEAYVRAASEGQAEKRAYELDIEANNAVDDYYEVDAEYDEDDLPGYVDPDEIIDLED